MGTKGIAQGTLLSSLWGPKWEGNPKRGAGMCVLHVLSLFSHAQLYASL